MIKSLLACVTAWLPIAAFAGLTMTSRKALAAEPAKGWLFRGDASVAPGAYVQRVSNTAGEEAEAYAALLGPRLGLNLGFAPSRHIRLGLAASADFAMNVAEKQGIPYTGLDAWMRWIVGPTVGFRFGPRAPWELEAGIGFSHLMFVGSQADICCPSPTYALGADQLGAAASALLMYRPGGADSIWGLHTGLLGGWGHLQQTSSPGNTTSANAFTGSLLLGVSVGL